MPSDAESVSQAEWALALKKHAEAAYALKESLPSLKFGWEDVPIFVQQCNYYATDKLGDSKRTREITAKAHFYLKQVFPEMTREKESRDKSCLPLV